MTPAAARASAGSRDEQCTCPTCAHTSLSHRRRGSDTGQGTSAESIGGFRRERWRCRLRRTKAAATLQVVVGLIPDLWSALARALAQCTRAKHNHRCGAQARGASLRAAFAAIFGKANAPGTCECKRVFPCCSCTAFKALGWGFRWGLGVHPLPSDPSPPTTAVALPTTPRSGTGSGTVACGPISQYL